MVNDAVIALLEQRLAHLNQEEGRQPKSQYAQIMKWRRLECEYLIGRIKELEMKP